VYKKIVVGTDGSPTAGVALDHAIGLAKVTGATVHIVNAYKAMTTMAAIGPDFSARTEVSWKTTLAGSVTRRPRRRGPPGSTPLPTSLKATPQTPWSRSPSTRTPISSWSATGA